MWLTRNVTWQISSLLQENRRRDINESVIADNDMDLRFTFSQKCCLCTGKFKTFSATQKHAERTQTVEGDRVLGSISPVSRVRSLILPEESGWVRAHFPEQRLVIEPDRVLNVLFLDNEENEASVPDIGFLNRRSQDFKIEYLSWLAGLTEQINASLNPRLRGKWRI